MLHNFVDEFDIDISLKNSTLSKLVCKASLKESAIQKTLFKFEISSFFTERLNLLSCLPILNMTFL